MLVLLRVIVIGLVRCSNSCSCSLLSVLFSCHKYAFMFLPIIPMFVVLFLIFDRRSCSSLLFLFVVIALVPALCCCSCSVFLLLLMFAVRVLCYCYCALLLAVLIDSSIVLGSLLLYVVLLFV